MHRKPYNPAAATSGPQVHDRRAVDINRGTAGHIAVVEVDDPFERGGRISAVRSVRGDPLGDRLSRGFIYQAQFEAGRRFQKLFGIAERGPKSPALSEAVDGDPPRDGLTDAQLTAWKQLTRYYRALGQDGSALVTDLLIHNRTMSQIVASRGLAGQEWNRYVAKRFAECLDCLAVVFGLASR